MKKEATETDEQPRKKVKVEQLDPDVDSKFEDYVKALLSQASNREFLPEVIHAAKKKTKDGMYT